MLSICLLVCLFLSKHSKSVLFIHCFLFSFVNFSFALFFAHHSDILCPFHYLIPDVELPAHWLSAHHCSFLLILNTELKSLWAFVSIFKNFFAPLKAQLLFHIQWCLGTLCQLMLMSGSDWKIKSMQDVNLYWLSGSPQSKLKVKAEGETYCLQFECRMTKRQMDEARWHTFSHCILKENSSSYAIHKRDARQSQTFDLQCNFSCKKRRRRSLTYQSPVLFLHWLPLIFTSKWLLMVTEVAQTQLCDGVGSGTWQMMGNSWGLEAFPTLSILTNVAVSPWFDSDKVIYSHSASMEPWI